MSNSTFKKVFIIGPKKEKSPIYTFFSLFIVFVGYLSFVMIVGVSNLSWTKGAEILWSAIVLVPLSWFLKKLWVIAYWIFFLSLTLWMAVKFSSLQLADQWWERLNYFLIATLVFLIVSAVIFVGHVYYYWKNRISENIFD